MNVLETALQWHSLGIATIPILAGSKKPALPAWRQYQERLPTERELRAWWVVEYGIAVVCGWQGLTVVDFDDLDYWESWQAGHDPIDTYRVKTRRGWHLYFFVEEPVSCWHSEVVDVKAAGGYVLAPPSIHPSGHKYQGYGSPEQIATIASIKEVIPEYEDVPQWQPRERGPVDPYDAAMREPIGTSVAEIKAAWRWEDIIPLNGRARRGVIMTNCPLHPDDTASFAIYADGHAHCFGCQWHGDLIDLFAAMNNLTVQEALREMA